MRAILRTTIILAIIVGIITASTTAHAAIDYEFAGSVSSFGKPTVYDEPIPLPPAAQNTRRNKDAALSPPAFGIYSGDIPTEYSSLYHDHSRNGGSVALSGGVLLPVGNSSDNQLLSGFSYATTPYEPVSTGFPAPGTSNVTISHSEAFLPSTYYAQTYYTEPLYYEDGSIGTLHIPKLNRTLKVYHGESLENMKKGIGHFESSSAWDGNTALAGHNRGAAPYFSFVKDLNIGDTLVYTTLYGSRKYEVYRKERISDTDYTGLAWSPENILTLITCIEDQPSLRWLVQAREVVSP